MFRKPILGIFVASLLSFGSVYAQQPQAQQDSLQPKPDTADIQANLEKIVLSYSIDGANLKGSSTFTFKYRPTGIRERTNWEIDCVRKDGKRFHSDNSTIYDEYGKPKFYNQGKDTIEIINGFDIITLATDSVAKNYQDKTYLVEIIKNGKYGKINVRTKLIKDDGRIAVTEVYSENGDPITDKVLKLTLFYEKEKKLLRKIKIMIKGFLWFNPSLTGELQNSPASN